MQNQTMQLPWDAPGWLEEVTSWIQAQLAALGYQVASPVELLHQRVWSAFARLTTDQGVVYFKAPAPAYAYEAPLTQLLSRLRPDCSVPLLAVDLRRGWILSADAGATLRSVDQSPGQIDHWLKLLPLYVELQIEMAERVPELLALGMLDRRLAHFPRLYDELLQAEDSLRVGLELGLTADEYRRLVDLRPQVADWCGELAAYGLPETLVHEEVHENNVLVRDERYTFTDWSDCSLGHPFFTMIVTLRATAHWLKLEEYGSEMVRLRDAYLEPWTRFAPRKQLLAAFSLALRLGMANRALSWRHATAALSAQDREPYLDYVPGWLQDFLNYDGQGFQ